MVYSYSQWQIHIWVVHYALRLIFGEEVYFMVVPHQWAHLVEDQLVDTPQFMIGEFIGLEFLKFNYPLTVPLEIFFFLKDGTPTDKTPFVQ